MQPDARREDCVSRQTLVAATAAAVNDVEERPSQTFPSSEEVRMVRAIALSTLTEALMRGVSHVSFRGFRIAAARISSRYDERLVVQVELVILLDGHMIDREIAEFPALYLTDGEVQLTAMRNANDAVR